MKTEQEVKEKLEEVYSHRLAVRIERMTSVCCRNCTRCARTDFDLGEFGRFSKWSCLDNHDFRKGCEFFVCRHSVESIERGLLDDIRDPSICGAKEPKIGVLMWFLHKRGGSSASLVHEEAGGKRRRSFWRCLADTLFFWRSAR